MIEVFARVKLEGPRVLLQELVQLGSHPNVGNLYRRVDRCTIDRAEEVVGFVERPTLIFFIIRIVLNSGALHELSLTFEEHIDELPFKGATALYGHWVKHDLAADQANQMIWHIQLFDVFHVLGFVLICDLLLQQLKVGPFCLRNLEKDSQLIQSFHLVFEVQENTLFLVLLSVELLHRSDLFSDAQLPD